MYFGSVNIWVYVSFNNYFVASCFAALSLSFFLYLFISLSVSVSFSSSFYSSFSFSLSLFLCLWLCIILYSIPCNMCDFFAIITTRLHSTIKNNMPLISNIPANIKNSVLVYIRYKLLTWYCYM